jgi:hypothetical protein
MLLTDDLQPIPEPRAAVCSIIYLGLCTASPFRTSPHPPWPHLSLLPYVSQNIVLARRLRAWICDSLNAETEQGHRPLVFTFVYTTRSRLSVTR